MQYPTHLCKKTCSQARGAVTVSLATVATQKTALHVAYGQVHYWSASQPFPRCRLCRFSRFCRFSSPLRGHRRLSNPRWPSWPSRRRLYSPPPHPLCSFACRRSPAEGKQSQLVLDNNASSVLLVKRLPCAAGHRSWSSGSESESIFKIRGAGEAELHAKEEIVLTCANSQVGDRGPSEHPLPRFPNPNYFLSETGK